MNKRQLQQARWIEREVMSKSERIERLWALAEKCTARYGASCGFGGDSVPDRRAEIVAKIVDLQRALQDDVKTLLDRQEDILADISALPDPRMRILMEQRYISGKTWEQVADLLGCDMRQVYRIHGRALEIFFGGRQ